MGRLAARQQKAKEGIMKRELVKTLMSSVTAATTIRRHRTAARIT